MMSNALPISRDGSPVHTSRNTRADGDSTSFRPNLALSGQTTTARGHVIVPPTKAKIIAFEYEHVPGDEQAGIKANSLSTISDEHDCALKSRTSKLNFVTTKADLPNGDIANNSVELSDSRLFESREKTTKYEFGNIGKGDKYIRSTPVGDGSRRANIANKTMSADVDESTVLRASRIDRNHRSIAPTPLGVVSGTKSEAASRYVELREDYAVKRQGRAKTDVRTVRSNSGAQRDIGTGQVKTTRRRRARGEKSNELFDSSSKQSTTPVANFNALGNAANTKRSSFLPEYIQPIIEENISRRGQRNCMPFSPARRDRKISTEMNRYESSSSSSSSSSEIEQESPNRMMNTVLVERVKQTRNPAPETQYTSDDEKRKHECRRRVRRSHVPGSTIPEGSADNLSDPKRSQGSAMVRARAGGGLSRRMRRRHNLAPPLEDKYVSLPDDYKQSGFLPSGDCAPQLQPAESVNSQDVVGGKHSNDGNDSSRSKRDTQFTRSPRRESGRTEITVGSETSMRTERNSLNCVEQGTAPSDISHSEKRVVEEFESSEHEDFSVSLSELGSLQGHPVRSTEEELTVKTKRDRNVGESAGVGNIRSIFENNDAPKGDLGRSFLKKAEVPHDNTKRRTSKGSVHDIHESAVIQSQPKLKARKVGEDYWPRDEVTKLQLSHSRTASATSPTAENDYETATLTMQETIDQLHQFADEDTPPKSRSNSVITLNDYTKNNETDRPAVDVSPRAQKHSGRRSLNNRPVGTNLPRGQKVKIACMDVSPCMSSTETLKECSSGEYQSKNSRSPSIESTASNPETILNASLIKEREKVVYGQSTSIQDEDDLFIAEEQEVQRDNYRLPLPDTKNPPTSADAFANSSMSMLEQMKGLTEALQAIRSKNIKQAQPLNTANLQKATVLTVPILHVSSHLPCLETLREHPEDTSSDLVQKHQRKQQKHTSTAHSNDKAKTHFENKIDDSSEIDEGIVTKVEANKDPLSYLKLQQKLEESNKRTKRSTQPRDSGDSNGNESTRSLSDPSANRKRSSPGESSIDSNLLPALQTGYNEEMGLVGDTSLSSSSQFSEHASSNSETLNAEFINEESEFGENGKNQTRSGKKKAKSDPNPDGFVIHDFRRGTDTINEDDRPGLQSASSEPNVVEQTDGLGDLDQFKKYQNNKAISTQEKSPAKLKLVEEEIFGVYGDMHAHVSPRNGKQSMKSKLRAQNVENSIVGKLMAEHNPPNAYNYKNNRSFDEGNHSSSTPSPVASGESSPTQKQVAETLLESEEQFFELYDTMTTKDFQELSSRNSGHARSNSEPVQMMTTPDHISTTLPSQKSHSSRGRRTGIIQAPSLVNVGPRYSTAETVSLHSDIHEPGNYHHAQSVDTVFSPAKESYGFSPIREKGKPDMRLQVLINLLETEESYVSSLRILYQDYMTPLKHPENHSTCEPRLVDEMFYKIPQLYQHHEKFYENVQQCYEDWNYKDVRLGELFLNSFNKDALLDTYSAYITNYLNAREAVRTAEAKEAFRRFIEQCRSENKEKQGLADLMIKPVQRIPRYELLIKDMLKHTPEGHLDRDGLLIARKEIHKLADQMNDRKKEAEAAEIQDRLLLDLEQLLEGCMDLCIPKRRFVRQDIVAEIKGATKKDRSLWLFSDLIVCTTRKGKGAAFRRNSMMNLTIGQDPRFPNIDSGYKYKFLWKFPLEDVEHLKGNTAPGRHAVDKQLQALQNDMEILTNMHQQATRVECNHVQLDEALKEIINYVRGQIAEKKQLTFQPICPPGRVELGIPAADGMKTFLFEFTDENKLQFEKDFAKAKRSLTTQKNRWEPTFMKAIPISRTRAGMQFSCAASNVDASPEVREVWVCNTDGYVGQVCFLTLEPEPIQTQCITVCHAKICCITQVPTWDRRLVPAQTILQQVAKGTIMQHGNPALSIMPWDDQEDTDEENTSPHSTMSSRSSPCSQSPYSTMNGGNDNLASADLISLHGFGAPKSDHNHLTDGAAWKKHSNGSTLHGSLEDLLVDGESVIGNAQGILSGKDSMWLGTEDGKIHIYPSSESVRGNKHCVRLAHSAAVHCILYHEGQVFVALSNGDLVIYTRNLMTGEWDFENQKTKSKVSSPCAITKMVVVEQNELWCGCQNLIKIINIKELVETDHFTVISENKRQIYCMVCGGYGVWVALDKRPEIKLYHTVTHDLLADIDVSNPVNKMLASADAIIRQHKRACLRITALLVCNDLLWVGTSAGVVLTLTLPKITPHTNVLAMPVIPQGLAYGHTGHVRFLACAEIPDKEQNLSRRGSRRTSTSIGKRRSSSSSNASNPSRTVSVIISGGDGYEDFRMNSNSESAGRDDSTNHLLVWKV